MATVVAIITSMVVANATQTITTPNAVFVSYSLAANRNSAPITPVTNRPVLVMGCCTTFAGVGQVSLLHSSFPSIAWTGFEPGYPVTPTSAISTAPGIHIVYIDFSHRVDIQVASADTIQIHNGATQTLAGNVTLVW